MLTHPTIDKLHALHLGAMATAFDQQRGASQYAELTFDDRFGLLVETEWTAREQRKLAQRLRHAKLRYPAALEDVDFTTPRGLQREVVLQLGTGAWIRDHHNLCTSSASSPDTNTLRLALSGFGMPLGGIAPASLDSHATFWY